MIQPIRLSPADLFVAADAPLDAPLKTAGTDAFVLPLATMTPATGKLVPAIEAETGTILPGGKDAASETAAALPAPVKAVARLQMAPSVAFEPLLPLGEGRTPVATASSDEQMRALEVQAQTLVPLAPPFAQVIALLLSGDPASDGSAAATSPTDGVSAEPLPTSVAIGEPPTPAGFATELEPRLAPSDTPAVPDTPPAPPLAIHPADMAKLARAGVRRPEVVAGEPIARDPVTLAPGRTPEVADLPTPASDPSSLAPTPAAAPTSDTQTGGHGDQPGGGDRRPEAAPPPPEMIERVEFDGPDGVARLKLVHEAVGRLSITLDTGGEATDVRLASEDAGVRQMLADAVPTLLRLAEERRVTVGSVAIGSGAEPGRGDRDRLADRRPPPSPRISTAAPHTIPNSRRSAGLFA